MFDFLFGWRKASNCKRLIRRVQCRLKLLKNKRCSIVRQLRDDMAQLLKYGHDQSAFHRVEQLFKDESIVAVYDLLDHFCEFIIIHLSYIRKHRDCPNDINEAVSTLIFASARCGDLPELPVIRKLFGERYGQRFALVALELLPGNLVNRQIKENLSIKSVPDDVKCRLVDEIARSCLQPGPLAIEYYSEVQQEQANKNKGDQVLKSDFQTNLVQDFNIVEGEGKILHVIEPCHSQQGSDSTGGSISPKLLTWSVNRKEEGRVVGNYTHHLNSLYESRIPPPSVDKEAGMPVESSSDSSSQLPKDMIYLDDIEEFKSPMSEDQRLFMFRSLVVRSLDESNGEKFDSWNEKVGSRSSRKSRKVSGKRERMRSVSREGISVKDVASIIYYEGSFDDSRNDSHSSHHRRKHHKKIPSYKTQKPSGQPCRVNTGKDRFAHDCSLEDPCYFCTSDDRDDDFGSQKRRITTLEGFSVKEEKVEHRVCCPCCRCFRNGERNNREAKWELVLQKPRRDYYNGQVPNEPVKKVEKADGFDHPPYLRTVTMPVERPSDCHVDNMLRSNSFPFKQASRLSNGSSPCRHVHPKLPDYDQLEAKFMALKKANMQCKSNQFTLAEA